MATVKSRIKKGDNVVVRAGKNKGRTGVVLRVFKPKLSKKKKTTGLRVIIEGVNMVKKHVRGNPQQNKPGGIIEKEAPLHISNVALVNPVTDKADKVTYKVLEDGRKVRVFKSNGEMVQDAE